MAWLRMGGRELQARLLEDQGLLRLPLVRNGDSFVAGPDEDAWLALLAADQ